MRLSVRYFVPFMVVVLIVVVTTAYFAGAWWLLAVIIGAAIGFWAFGTRAGLVIVILCATAAIRTPRKARAMLERACVARGRVTQVTDTSFKGTTIRFQGRCINMDAKINTKVFLNVHKDVENGQKILIELRPPPIKRRHGRSYMYGKVIGRPVAESFLSRFRNQAQLAIYGHLSRTSAAFLSAVVLGNRRAVPKKQRMEFARLGLAHLLALSGLHTSIAAFMVSYLVLIIAGIFAWQIRPQADLLRLRVITALGAALSVSAIGLNHPSSRRAAIFAGLVMFFYLIRWRTRLINLLMLSALMSIVVFPRDLLTLSFAFSYLAVLGLALFAKKGRHWWSRPLYATLGASVFTFPMALLIFHVPCPAGPVANIVFLPIFVPVLSLGMGFTYLSPFLPVGALNIAAIPVDFIVSGFLGMISFADHLLLPVATVPFAVISYVAQMGILWFSRRVRNGTDKG